MPLTVWKYQWPHQSFTPHERTEFAMWPGAKIIHVGIQDGIICLWAVTSPEALKVWRRFVLVGTGWVSDDIDAARYVGTVHTHDGRLVWHIFEKTGDA